MPAPGNGHRSSPALAHDGVAAIAGAVTADVHQWHRGILAALSSLSGDHDVRLLWDWCAGRREGG